MDANCDYGCGASRLSGVDFSAVAEESARIADQSGRRLDKFFARVEKLDKEYIESLELEVEQRCKRITALEAQLAIEWQELGMTDKALDEARHELFCLD